MDETHQTEESVLERVNKSVGSEDYGLKSHPACDTLGFCCDAYSANYANRCGLLPPPRTLFNPSSWRNSTIPPHITLGACMKKNGTFFRAAPPYDDLKPAYKACLSGCRPRVEICDTFSGQKQSHFLLDDTPDSDALVLQLNAKQPGRYALPQGGDCPSKVDHDLGFCCTGTICGAPVKQYEKESWGCLLFGTAWSDDCVVSYPNPVVRVTCKDIDRFVPLASNEKPENANENENLNYHRNNALSYQQCQNNCGPPLQPWPFCCPNDPSKGTQCVNNDRGGCKGPEYATINGKSAWDNSLSCGQACDDYHTRSYVCDLSESTPSAKPSCALTNNPRNDEAVRVFRTSRYGNDNEKTRQACTESEVCKKPVICLHPPSSAAPGIAPECKRGDATVSTHPCPDPKNAYAADGDGERRCEQDRKQRIETEWTNYCFIPTRQACEAIRSWDPEWERKCPNEGHRFTGAAALKACDTWKMTKQRICCNNSNLDDPPSENRCAECTNAEAAAPSMQGKSWAYDESNPKAPQKPEAMMKCEAACPILRGGKCSGLPGEDSRCDATDVCRKDPAGTLRCAACLQIDNTPEVTAQGAVSNSCNNDADCCGYAEQGLVCVKSWKEFKVQKGPTNLLVETLIQVGTCEKKAGKACQLNADCGSVMACHNRVCTPPLQLPCSSSIDCPPLYQCGPMRKCMPSFCTADSQCPRDYTCNAEEKCMPSFCTADSQCPLYYTCNAEQKCMPSFCTGDGQCPSGYTCTAERKCVKQGE